MTTALPVWLIPALLVLVALILGAVLFVLWRRRPAPKKGAPAAVIGADVPQLDKTAFAAAIAAVYPATAQVDKYQLPCVLVCGDPDADQAAVLAAAGLKPVGGGAASPSGWWQDTDGAAFQLPAEAWLGDDGPWFAFLDRLERHRSRRPLDALAWLIPLASLQGDEAALAAAGQRLSRKLVDLRVRLGLQLPVYAIVCDCDAVPGFEQLAAALPSRLQQQSLGCSNPHGLGAAFSRPWAEQGVAVLVARLRALVAELGVQGRAEPFDKLYLLPAAMADALANLPALLDLGMRRNATLAPVDLRGFYLSARVSAAASAPAAGAQPDEYAVLPVAAPAPRRAVFCEELFARRIFAEFGLAVLAPRKLASERGMHRYVMVGGVALALLGLALLPRAYSVIEDKKDALRPPLALIAPAIADRAAAPTAKRQNVAFNHSSTPETLLKIDSVSEWSLSTPWLPLSYVWPFGIDPQLRSFLHTYYQKVVLDDIHAALTARGSAIATGAEDKVLRAPIPEAARMPREFTEMNNFVDAVLKFEANRRRLTLLSSEGTGEWSDAAGLLNYLFNLSLQPRSRSSTELFDDMISHASLDANGPEEHSAETARFGAHLRKLHGAWLAQLFNEKDVRAASIDITDEIRSLSTRNALAARDPDAIEGMIGKLDKLLASRLSWTNGVADLGQPYQQLDAKLGQSKLLGPQLAQEFNQLTLDAAGEFHAKVEPLTVGNDAVLAFDKENRLGVNAELGALMVAFNQLKRYPFAQARPQPATAPVQRSLVQWDVAGLEAAGAVFKDYLAYEGDSAIKPPPRYHAALQNFARQRAAAHMNEHLAQAAARTAPQQDWRATNFDQARQQLPELIGGLRKLGQGASADRWQAMVDDQAEQTLHLLHAQLHERPLYLPDAGAVGNWNGGRLGAVPAYGAIVTADLKDYLAAQLNEVRAYADAAKGARAWLEGAGAGRPGASAALLASWRKLDAELGKYVAKDPTATVSQLEHLVLDDLNAIDSANCSDKLVQMQRGTQPDYFQRQGRRAAGMFLLRCTQLQTMNAHSAWQSIARHYNATLAGNYPFAASINAAPAEPEQVRYMLRLLDVHRAEVREWLGRQKGESGTKALAFLDELEAGRELLTAMLKVERGAPATLDLWPKFRTNRAAENGAEQIIALNFDTGTGAAAAGKPQPWRVGEPITVNFVWAKDSLFQPAANPSLHTDFRVNGNQASWRYTGPWALLKLMSNHAVSPGDLGSQEPGIPQALRFTVPTQLIGGKPAQATVVFGRLDVTPHGKAERLALPSFPHAPAPVLAPAARVAAGF